MHARASLAHPSSTAHVLEFLIFAGFLACMAAVVVGVLLNTTTTLPGVHVMDTPTHVRTTGNRCSCGGFWTTHREP